MSNTISILEKRRSIYAIGDKVSHITQEELTELIFSAVELSPSAFNSQSSRVVILFEKAHHHLWNQIVRETLRKIVGNGDFSGTSEKIDSFDNGFGTVLFFEDQEVINGLMEKFPLYAENFPYFSNQSNGMAQLAVWTALAEKDIGASLQHYNPLIDVAVKEYWEIPESWLLVAQMPFGSVNSSAGSKDIMSREKRFLVKNK